MIHAGARSMSPVNHCMRSHALARCDWSDLPTTMCAHCLGHDMHVPIGVPAPPPAAHIAAQRPPRVTGTHDLPAKDSRKYAGLPRRRDFPALCVNGRCRPPHDDGTPRPARPTDGRANICPDCEDRARAHLEWVADEWPNLDEALLLTPAKATDKVTAATDTAPTINPLVSAVMTAVEETLTFYARLIRDERGAVFPLTDPTPRDVARWVGRTHLPWLATHTDPGISEGICRDAAHAKGAIWRALYVARPTQVEIPDLRCTHNVPDDLDDEHSPTHPCGERLHALVTPGDDTMPDLICTAGHHTPPSEWTRTHWHRDAVHNLIAAIAAPTRYSTRSHPGQQA